MKKQTSWSLMNGCRNYHPVNVIAFPKTSRGNGILLIRLIMVQDMCIWWLPLETFRNNPLTHGSAVQLTNGETLYPYCTLP